MVGAPAQDSKPKYQNYLSAFEALEKKSNGHSSPWLSLLKKKAITQFAELGFPTQALEEWKYTNVAPIAETLFVPAPAASLAKRELSSVEPYLYGQMEWNRLVFVNGFLDRGLSRLETLPPGVRIMSLADALQKESPLVEKYLGRSAGLERNAFASLNTAFLEDGAFVYLPANVSLKEPLHFLFLSDANDNLFFSRPRNLVVLERGARLQLIETHAALSGGRYFSSAVSEIRLGEGASLEHYKIQNESLEAFHIASAQVHCGKDSRFNSFSVSLGGALSRNALSVLLDGPGCDCRLNGLYLAGGSQQTDHHILVDHEKPHGTSQQIYKGIMDGKARGVFSGKIFVRKDAQKTDARQINKNLLLSETARVDTKPQLEIFADDVKCSHGATVGQLDPEAVFYCKSRAIGEARARMLLTYGFASEVVEQIKITALREALNQMLRQRFTGLLGE